MTKPIKPARKKSRSTPLAAAPATGRIMLGAACTIQEAAALRAHILEQSAKAAPYEIDGSRVEMVDTAGVQLILAFALDCLERSAHYIWIGRSAALDRAIELLAVGALLESPGGAPYVPSGGAK